VAQLPYRARINPATVPFNDSASYRANNCLAVDGTNGIDVYANSFAASAERVDPTEKFQQVPPSPPSARSKKQFKNVILDTAPFTDVTLPPVLQPSGTPVNGSFNGGAFFLQKDGKTGVLALVRTSARNIRMYLLIEPAYRAHSAATISTL
jgi:hypothetical protein